MSDSDVPKREQDLPRPGAASEASPTERPRERGEPPSIFVQIVGAVAIALLAVVAAQGFLTAKEVNQTSQNVGALAARLLAESEKSKKLFEEVVILRGQVGELKNVLQISGGRGGTGAAAVQPPAPRDWTGVHVNELAPLLPVLAQYEGDMGEAWIYTDNEDFIESIARALEELQEGGMAVDVEQSQ